MRGGSCYGQWHPSSGTKARAFRGREGSDPSRVATRGNHPSRPDEGLDQLVPWAIERAHDDPAGDAGGMNEAPVADVDADVRNAVALPEGEQVARAEQFG